MPPTSTPYTPPPDDDLHIHYEDRHLIIVEKPHGLLSVPGRGVDKADCLEARLRRTQPGALTVHRLDMETSGLVVFALNREIQKSLSRLFEARHIHKEYEAVVAGDMHGEAGLIDLPLAPDWPNRPKQKTDATGKPAETGWRVTHRTPNATRVSLVPTTGRTHQLRVHLANIGHPILGDSLYGSEESRSSATRLLLHARRLRFVHPAGEEMIDVASPVPF